MTGVFKGRKHKSASMRLEHLAQEDNFQFVRSRLRVVRLFKHLIKAHHDRFRGLRAFTSLGESIAALDRILDHCELLLRRYAVGEMSVVELQELLQDDVYAALDDANLLLSNLDEGQASMDAITLMERIWEEIMSHVREFQDALSWTWDNNSFAMPLWRLQFERDEGPFLNADAVP